MKIQKKMEEALNEQVMQELYSAYLYLSMAAWSESANLPGFAHWLRLQAKEEVGHAMRIFDFLHDRGARVVLKAIAQPPAEFSSAMEVFERTLEHEKKVTALIEALCATAADTGDRASSVFLQWFVTEQVEEEKQAADVLAVLRMVEGKPEGLILVDRQLAQRQ